MSIKTEWYDASEKTIIVMTFSLNWSWADYANSKVDADTLLYSVQNPVYIINDLRKASLFPAGKRSAITNVSNTFDLAPPNLANVYLVGTPTFIRIIFNTLKRLASNRLLRDITMVKSMEDALAAIRQKQKEQL